jgi:hypothetical protein
MNTSLGRSKNRSQSARFLWLPGRWKSFEVASRPDLGDRAIFLTLPPIVEADSQEQARAAPQRIRERAEQYKLVRMEPLPR